MITLVNGVKALSPQSRHFTAFTLSEIFPETVSVFGKLSVSHSSRRKFNSYVAAETDKLHHEMSIFSRCHGSVFDPQLLPPLAEAELHTVDFLNSILISWLSGNDSNPVTMETPGTALFPCFKPFDTGIRVAALRADCISELGWKNKNRKHESIWTMQTHPIFM